MNNQIIGKWKTDPHDLESVRLYGEVLLYFEQNGRLTYTIFSDKKEQKIFMTYEIKEDLLITDQPSSPRKEETKFKILNGRLELAFNGVVSKYIKVVEK